MKTVEFNPETGNVETTVAEGETRGMRWKALLCVPQTRDGFLGVSGNYTAVRIYCPGLTLSSYAALFMAEGMRLMNRLAGMKRPDGEPYDVKFGGGWLDGNLYVQFRADDVPRSEWERFAGALVDEMSPDLLRMAVAE